MNDTARVVYPHINRSVCVRFTRKSCEYIKKNTARVADGLVYCCIFLKEKFTPS